MLEREMTKILTGDIPLFQVKIVKVNKSDVEKTLVVVLLWFCYYE